MLSNETKPNTIEWIAFDIIPVCFRGGGGGGAKVLNDIITA